MQKKIVCSIFVILLFLFSGPAHTNDLEALFQQVEKLKIERNGYVLGTILTRDQIKTATSNRVDSDSPNTYKFKDKNLFVVAQKKSNRVLVIYEQVFDASQQKIQDLIGDLYMNFDDPTVLAHDKAVYWAYTKKGKITSKQFDAARQDNKKLNILATVKFISDINIMEKIKEPATGQIYYIISSEPILKFFRNQKA
ncbi:hypothetical protein [Desulfobacula sp.]|jgi:hypothetical protein|uniref:hypothetical protein n=1 Tax=Desulfobacula sp. TaxID=2593537 RepID=UPI0039B8F09E|nr:hypothetical protein [Desulfobacula sp.]